MGKISKTPKEKINRFLRACVDRFTKDNYLCGDPSQPFFDMIIGGSDNCDSFVIDDIDLMLETKKNADKFFSFYKNSDLIWYENYLSHWGTQTTERYETWKKICEKIDGYCMKYYGCKWGKQKVEYTGNIPKYKPLKQISSTDDLKKYMVNRPLYKNDTFVGYIKKITPVTVIIGYHSEWDEADHDFYPEVPDCETYQTCVQLYGSPEQIPKIKYIVQNGKTYIKGDTLDNYEVLEDRVVIK